MMMTTMMMMVVKWEGIGVDELRRLIVIERDTHIFMLTLKRRRLFE